MRLKRKYRKNYFTEIQVTGFNELKNMLIDVEKGTDKTILKVTTSNPSTFEWYLANKLTSYGYKKNRYRNTTKIQCSNETNRDNLYGILRQIKNTYNIDVFYTGFQMYRYGENHTVFKIVPPVKPQTVVNNGSESGTTTGGSGGVDYKGWTKTTGAAATTGSAATQPEKDEGTSSTTYIIIAGVILIAIVLMRKK